MVKVFIFSTFLNPDKMKAIFYIIIGVIFYSCTSKQENYGKLIIVGDFYPIYENDDIYIPHDYFVEVDMQEWIDTVLFF